MPTNINIFLKTHIVYFMTIPNLLNFVKINKIKK